MALRYRGVNGICGGDVNRNDVPDGGIHLSSKRPMLRDPGIATVPQRGTASERIPNSNHVVHVSVPCPPCALCSTVPLETSIPLITGRVQRSAHSKS